MKTTLAAAILLLTLTLTASLAAAQSPPLIYACVDQQGRLRIVPQGTSCGPRETLLSWPAEPGAVAAASYYYRERIFTASGGVPTGQILLCDDAADTTIAGGYAWDPPYAGFTDTSILASYSCRQSGGRCAGGRAKTAGGWWRIARHKPGI
jgi:hypothetical protein